MAQRPDESAPATGKPVRARRSNAGAKPKTALPKRAAARRGKKVAAPKVIDLTVAAGVERDISAIEARDPDLANSGLATVARALAREIDDRSNSATSKSMCARALQDILAQLRELAPPEEARDGVDEITSRRAARAASR